MKDSALWLASLGFPVLPLHWPRSPDSLCSCNNPGCKSAGKHPLTPHGVNDASTETTFVEQWWDEYPLANIGIATGHVCDVIDIDGPEALASFDSLVAKFGIPQFIAAAKTGRDGGRHIFTAGPGAPCWTGGLNGWPEHLDGKGQGGYVVAPPSLHASGRRYEWVKEPGSDVEGSVPWPEWHEKVASSFPDRFTRPVTSAVINGGGHPLRIVQPWQPGRAARLFADVVQTRIVNDVTAAGEGSRWQVLQTAGVWGAAGLVLGGQITPDEAVTLCTELGTALGLDPAEIARIPREVARALGKRREPIQPRAVQSPADGPAMTGPSPGMPDGPRPADGPLSEASELERMTALYRLRALARDGARRQIAREAAGQQAQPEEKNLAAFLAEKREHITYRIDGLWPSGGRVILAAQYKAGKTTAVGNLIRCLADGSNFLSRYPVMPVTGRIVLLDTEMSLGMLHAWLGAQGIARTEQVSLFPMRGRVSSFDITDEVVREHWTHQLKELNAEIVILDCLAPVLTACGLDEGPNTDMGTFLNAFDAMVSDANVPEALIVHHMGHAGERSRGASRLRDWPDVEWQLIREGQEDNSAPADAPRFFKAYGRDVDVPEQLLEFEPNMRWLSVNGSDGSRKQVREHRYLSKITDYVKANPGQSSRMIAEMVGGRKATILANLKELTAAGTLVPVEVIKNHANAVLYFDKDYREDTAGPGQDS